MLKEANKIAREIADSFLDGGSDPTEEMVKVAKSSNLTARQIDLCSRLANRKIIVGLHKEAVKQDGVDPHFTFPTVKTAKVLAVIRKKPSTAVAMPPPMSSSMDSVLPRAEGADQFREQRATPEQVAKDLNLEQHSKDMAARALQILRDQMKRKESKYRALRMAFEAALGRLDKKAEQQLLGGTPVEVLGALDRVSGFSINKIATRVSGWGHRINHIDEEFELDEDHEVVKLANSVAGYHDELEKAASQLQEAKDQYEIAQMQFKRMQ